MPFISRTSPTAILSLKRHVLSSDKRKTNPTVKIDSKFDR